jgi:hypothetical protein
MKGVPMVIFNRTQKDAIQAAFESVKSDLKWEWSDLGLPLDSSLREHNARVAMALLHELEIPVAKDKVTEVARIFSVMARDRTVKVNMPPEPKRDDPENFRFDGVPVNETELVEKIKQYLPTLAHGSISGCINDIVLGRGKATGNHAAVLHASAGRNGTGRTCTLFFKRDGKDLGNVIGVGQHTTSNSYAISWTSGGLLGRTLVLT